MITIISNPLARNFGFTNLGRHAASRPTGARALVELTDIIPSRDHGSRITAITNQGNHAASLSRRSMRLQTSPYSIIDT